MIGLTEFAAPGALGNVLADIQVTPVAFTDTRVSQEAQLWSRWRPRALKLEIVSSAGAFVTGSYVAGWSASVMQALPRGPDAVRVVTTMEHSRQAHISQPLVLPIPSDPTQRWYLCSGSSEDRDHGSVFVVLSAPVGNLSGKIALSLRLHWTMEFSGPSMPNIAVVEAKIYADPAYTPYFTDSVNDWENGKYLTFKAHEGGNAVPFVGIEPDTIYKSTVEISWYDAAKADKSLTSQVVWGVRIHDYYQPAMAVFRSRDKAKVYVESHAASAVLDFVKAGPWIYGNPAWVLDSQTSALSVRVDDTPNVPPSGGLERSDGLPRDAELEEIRVMLRSVMLRLDRIDQRRDSDFSVIGCAPDPGNVDPQAT